MATVRLLKERKVKIDDKEVTQKKGELVSVPFIKGRELIAAGEAEAVVSGSLAVAKPKAASGEPVSAEVFADAQRKHNHAAKLAAERIEFLEGEIRRLAADLDAATKPAPKGDDKK